MRNEFQILSVSFVHLRAICVQVEGNPVKVVLASQLPGFAIFHAFAGEIASSHGSHEMFPEFLGRFSGLNLMQNHLKGNLHGKVFVRVPKWDIFQGYCSMYLFISRKVPFHADRLK